MDPMMRAADPNLHHSELSLFNNTSRLAGEVAARGVGRRHQQILQLLRDRGPLALWEIAAALSVFDHQVSGRLTELKQQGLIQPLGQRRTNPATGCPAEVYEIAASPTPPEPTALDRLADRLGYEPTLSLASEGLFCRQPIDPSDTWPGVAYSRHAQGPSGVDLPRVTYRFALIECPLCGAALQLLPPEGPQAKKRYQCLAGCRPVYELTLVTPPGKPPRLALVQRTL